MGNNKKAWLTSSRVIKQFSMDATIIFLNNQAPHPCVFICKGLASTKVSQNFGSICDPYSCLRYHWNELPFSFEPKWKLVIRKIRMNGRCYAGHANTPQYDQIIQMLEVLWEWAEAELSIWVQIKKKLQKYH